jgi:multicomponent Na+:H+ antiporter subunit B
MKTSIVKNIVKLILPLIQIFGAYVILFGHISPGGGFSGGSIIGSSLILYRLVYGEERANKRFVYHYMMKLLSVALVLYGSLKGFIFVLEHLGFEGVISTGTPGTLLSGGLILPLNVLVGVVVSITFYFIATLFEEGEIEHVDVAE